MVIMRCLKIINRQILNELGDLETTVVHEVKKTDCKDFM
jgi:hypothetical protein